MHCNNLTFYGRQSRSSLDFIHSAVCLDRFCSLDHLAGHLWAEGRRPPKCYYSPNYMVRIEKWYVPDLRHKYFAVCTGSLYILCFYLLYL